MVQGLRPSCTSPYTPVEVTGTFVMMMQLSAAVNDFSQYYLMNETEEMAAHITKDFAAEPYVLQGENSYPNVLWFEVTTDHVEALMEAGTMVFEVPFAEWEYEYTQEPPTWKLLVTVVLEDGAFKVSDCTVQR